MNLVEVAYESVACFIPLDRILMKRYLFVASLLLAYVSQTNAQSEEAHLPQVSDFHMSWSVSSEAVYSGLYGCASDPTVISVDGKLRMYYTGLDPESDRTVICVVTSIDGKSWQEIDTGHRLSGLALAGIPGQWDENIESAYVVKANGKYLMYYTGYTDKGDPLKGFPAALGIATSDDGIRFKRLGQLPALSPTMNGLDTHAIYSPVVVPYQDGFRMIYCGHAYSGPNPGVRILGATSKDGITWKKHSSAVLEGSPLLPWTKDGVGEPALLKDGDDYWLFFTGLLAEERCIGIAKGPTPFGPWEINRDPIISATDNAFANRQVLGPSVTIEAGKARMWLLGTCKDDEQIRIGYADSPWPPHP